MSSVASRSQGVPVPSQKGQKVVHKGRAGLARSAAIDFKLPGVSVTAAALREGRERILSPIAAENNSLRVALKPWETSTVRVQVDY